MFLLAQLPDELILTIIDHLTPASLLNLNPTSRHFYNLTIAQIYSYFDGARPSKFLRTITSPNQHPYKLSECVKKVSWNASASKAHVDRGVGQADKDSIARAYQLLGLAETGQNYHPLNVSFTRQSRGSPAAQLWFLEFFLSFLPNVSELEVYDAWQFSDYRYW
jgi:hypothetical protein